MDATTRTTKYTHANGGTERAQGRFYRAARLALAVCVSLAAAHVATRPLRAAQIFNVTKTTDTYDGVCHVTDCSLREAVVAANVTVGADIINLPAGTYIFSIAGQSENQAITGDLDITEAVTLIGAGAATTIIDANILDRVVDIIGDISVQISGVTIRKGNAPSPQGGAGINNAGTLTLSHSVVMSNTAAGSAGGGIFTDRVVNLDNVILTGNQAIFGGGLFTGSSVTSTVTNSTFSYNSAAYGGGHYNKIGKVIIRLSTFNNNTAISGGGGGLNNFQGGILEVSDSTIRNNTAAFGGGINMEDGSLTLSRSAVISNTAFCYLCDALGGGIQNYGVIFMENSTVSNNTALSENDCAPICQSNVAQGGGILNFNNVTLDHSTIASNSASQNCPAGVCGGNGANLNNYATLTLKSSIVAYPLGGAVGPAVNCSGTSAIGSAGLNIDSDDTCGLSNTGDLGPANPQLLPLSNNGGPTWTRALALNSPAVDSDSNTNCPATDQRGFARPFDGDANASAVCDRGAFELGYRLFLPVMLSPFCEIEPNNGNLTATGPIQFDKSYCGLHTTAQVSGGLDKDYFSFVKGAGGTITIDVTGLANTAQVQLFGTDGVTELAQRGASPFQIVCTGASACVDGSPAGNGNTNAAGTYFVRVSTPTGYNPAAYYYLTVTYAP